MSTERPGAKMDAAINEASNLKLNGEQLSDLFTRIATMGYFMATEVGRLQRRYMSAEMDRKAYVAKEVIKGTMDGTSNAKAVARVEASQEFWDLKNVEIDAEAEYQAYRLKLDAVKGVLSSIQMRIALLRDERERVKQ